MRRSKKTSEYATVGGKADAKPDDAAPEAEASADPTDPNPTSNGDPAARDPVPGDPAATPELPPATPDERLAAVEAERNEIKDRMMRIAADFENWKKRARKEQDDAVVQAREKVLKDMLDVIDNLERAVAAAQTGGDGVVDGAAVLKGVNLVLRLFQQKLERHDVRPFEAKGQPFDPRQHEAISRVESPDVPAGGVATELQKGYRIGDRLLRPAMVAVSSGPKASEG
jgi:molecular chaperone GrpE